MKTIKKILCFMVMIVTVLTSSMTAFAGDFSTSASLKVEKDTPLRLVTIEGYLSYKDGTPMRNTKIEVHSTPRYTTTDENGYYKVEEVEVGNHTFSILNEKNEPLVSCAMIITESGTNDEVEVTFMTEGVEPNVDTSNKDVIKIDALFPVYKVTVIDKYVDVDGITLIKSEKRCDDTYKKDSVYSYNALTVSNYEVVGQKSYTGTVSNNVTLTFTYKKIGSTPTSYTLKVYDKYLDENGNLERNELRTEDTMTENTNYSYSALNPAGYEVQGTKIYSGVVSKNDSFTFTYKKIKSIVDEYVTIKVYDKFYDASGNLTSSVLRESKQVLKGSDYSYSAKSFQGYSLTSSSSLKDKADKDLDIVFTYKQDKKEIFTVRVYDNYYDNLGNLINTSLRVVDNKEKGSSYSYDALTKEGFEVTSAKTISGVVDKDLELTFTYKKNAEIFTLTIIDEYYDEEGNLEKSDNRVEVQLESGKLYSYKALTVKGYEVRGIKVYQGIADANKTLTFKYEKAAEKKDTVTITVVDRFIYQIETDHENTYVEHAVKKVRQVETVTVDSEFSYSAQCPDTMQLLSKSSISGIAKEDMIITFSYKLIKSDTASNEIKSVITAVDESHTITEDITVPDFPEPVTGVKDNSSLYAIIAFILFVIVIVLIFRRKY